MSRSSFTAPSSHTHGRYSRNAELHWAGAARLGALVAAEPRDAHPEQPHRPRRRVGAQQLQRDRGDDVGVVGRLVQRVRPGHVGPVVEPHLDPDRAPGEVARAQAAAELLGERGDVPRHLRLVGDVDVEGRLGRLRLRLADRLDRGLVLEAGAGGQPAAHARAEGALQGDRVVRAQIGQAADPHPLQLLDRLRADAGDEARGRGGEALQRLLAGENDEAGGLAQLADDLGQQPVLRDPDRAGEPRVLADLGDDPPHRRLRSEQPAEVEVGLVEPDHLDRLRVGPQDVHHPRRGLPVGRKVRLQIDRIGQPPPRHRRRHRRMDPSQPPRLIARRGDHRPRPRPADHNRLPPQLRPPPQLDRRVEGVHIQMRDCAFVGHQSIVGCG